MTHIFEKKSYHNFIRLIFFPVVFFLISPDPIFSQTDVQKIDNPPSPTLHHEVKDNDYVPVSREDQERSPGYNYSMSDIFTIQVNVDENGQNIIGDAANEPSIAVDPNNRNKIVIGWRQFDTVNNSFRQAGWGFSTDGGQSWAFPGVIEPGIFRSDPVLGADIYGNFYYNSLTNDPTFICQVFKSTDGGATWDNGAFAQGGDKQWMTIDKTNGPGSGHIYAFWTSGFSVCYPGFFTRSTDNGGSFEDCLTIPNDPYWGTLAVGSDGKLYIGASIGSNFLVAKSTNAQDSSAITTWGMATVVNLDGSISFGGGPNPGGLLGQTLIGVDTSDSPYHGNVYLLCSVNRNSTSDPADVMFVRSTDGGVSWSSPIKINDDPGTSAYQWFGTMSVAPNGRIDAIWLDTRDNPGTYLSSLYYSNSKDGGVTWSQNERLSDFFDPHVGWPQQDKMGDYFDMVSDNNGASLSWAATFNGEQDVYYSHITDTTIVPVELLSFSASVASGVATLEWSTATELNNRGFEIERRLTPTPSQKEGAFQTIGFRIGKGTTSEPQTYFYADENLSAGTYQYRLKQVDFDGRYEYSDLVEVEIAPSVFSLSQNYPNPFNPSTKISWQSPVSGHQTIKIYDVLGNVVATLIDEFKPAGSYEVNFDGSQLSSGIYFYKLQVSPVSGMGGFVATKKMILLR